MNKLKERIKTVFAAVVVLATVVLSIAVGNSGSPALSDTIEAIIIGAVVMAAVTLVILLIVHTWHSMQDRDSEHSIKFWVYELAIVIAFGITLCMLKSWGVID